MAVVELDPLFVKALKLLHSRSKDAVDQLKQMADEAIAQRRGELALRRMVTLAFTMFTDLYIYVCLFCSMVHIVLVLIYSWY